VNAQERACARALVSAVLVHHGLDSARIRISGGQCTGGPGLVQVNLRVYGAPARIQVPGPSVVGAISAAAIRLDRQVSRLGTAWEPWPWPDPERRALGVPGAAPITRYKTYRLPRAHPCLAAARMAAGDYDVYLYTDADTGEDAVVYRSGPAGLCLSRQYTRRPPTAPGTLALTVNPRPVPELSPEQAAARLAGGWLPFVFFTDPGTGRGNLVYRRYDGDLALIRPPAAAPSQL
jgi:hypothetical protein